jgi:predicted transcriptional regulator
MQLRDALFTAIDKSGLTGKELSERANVSQAQISRFRKGEDLSYSTIQRLINGLPRETHHQFCTLLMVGEMTSQELADLIMVAVTQLQQQPYESQNHGLDKYQRKDSTISAA